MNVLVILGHPRPQSFCGALSFAFEDGARRAGLEIRRLVLSNLRFDPHVRTPTPQRQPMESDLDHAQQLMRWADHVVFVYPTWWGTMPALLKGFLDRVLEPGFAFAEREDGRGWDKLLRGKSAQLITTMDTPQWVYRYLYRQPGTNAMARATLQFCGFSPIRCRLFGPVKTSTLRQREQWLTQAHQLGHRLARGVLTIPERVMLKTRAWLAALRLQFYPMTFAAYAVGALGAIKLGATFSRIPSGSDMPHYSSLKSPQS
jgi:1,4-dihydroxy-2-naphthoate polyprenyltransferase